MKKKIVKIISIMLIIMILFSIFQTTFAASGKGLVNAFKGLNGVSTTEGEKLAKDIVGTVLSAIRIVAVGIAIIMITYLGIQYMSAAPSEKANIKNKMVAFVVGAIVVFGATKILEILKGFFTLAIK